jgi:RNA polymerase sigma-70 factor (sigma-E family)
MCREVVSVGEAGSSFELFVREHATSLLRTSFLLTGDLGAAEDLVQDTLTRLYPKWTRVTEAQAPLAYVRRCLTNEYLGGRRRGSPRLVELVVDADGGASGDAVPDVGDGVAAYDATIRLLRTLSERQRTALVLRYFHGMDDTEIAELLGCRGATVRSLVSRGLIAMRTADALVSSSAAEKRDAP